MDSYIQFRGTAQDVADIKAEARKYAMTPTQYFRKILLEMGVITP